MRYDEFVNRVQEVAGLPSHEVAAEMVEVVLSTLGERLYRTRREHLGAQLPDELKAYFWEQRGPERTHLDAEQFTIEEFYTRVQNRADISRREAEQRSLVVMQVLREAITAGEWQELHDALPHEYDELLGVEHTRRT